jgi:LuxR family maltose regulon positive regulatory protein
VLNNDRWFILEKWLQKLPDHLIQQRPDLLLAESWLRYHHFDISRIPSLIDAAETLLTDSREDRSLRGEIDFFRGYIYYFQNDGKLSLKHLDDARKRVFETNYEIRGQIEILYGLARQMQGQKEDALNTLNELLTYARWTEGIARTRLLVTLVYIHIISGNLEQATDANQQLYDFSSKGNYTYARAWSVYLKGLIHFYRNDLENAIDFFVRAIDQKYILHTRAATDGMAGLALAYQAVGKPENAIETVNSLREYGDSIHDPACSLIADSCHARLSIMQKGQKPVAAFLQGSLPPEENMVWWIEIPAVTYCRTLIAEGSEQSLQDAEMRLQKLLQLNQANHNIPHSISILALLAVVHHKQDRNDEALKAAEQALQMTDSSGIIQPFVELGPPMANLLTHLLKKEVAVTYVKKILDAFPDDAFKSRPEASKSEISSPHHPLPLSSSHPTTQPLVEPLTNRELDVLELLDQRLQNKEIADKLFITTETVKGHLKNIDQKLGVGNRRQAVEEAKRLKII